MIDALRGVALCGILFVNIPWMGRSALGIGLPASAPSLFDPEWQATIVSELFIEGTMRGLFTLLFGASVLLLLDRTGSLGSRRQAALHYRRALGLVALGLVHAHVFLWFGDILFAYGFAALFLFWLRDWPASRLIALALSGVLAMTALAAAEESVRLPLLEDGREAAQAAEAGRSLTEAEEVARAAYLEADRERFPEATALESERVARLGDYRSAQAFAQGLWAQYAAANWLGFVIAESVVFMALGMGLYRLGWLTAARSRRAYGALALGGYGLGVGLSALELTIGWRTGFAPEAFDLRIVTYEVSRLGGSLGHVGLVGLLATTAHGALGRAVGTAFSALGRLALTNYLVASIVGAFLFYGFGLGWFGRFSTFELWGLAAAILAGQTAASLVWLHVLRWQGPFEWLLRVIAHWRLAPLRLPAAAGQGDAR